MSWRRGAGATSGRAALAGRFLLMLAGSTVSTLAYALTIKAGIGLGPLYVFQDGFARATHISIGASVTATGFMFVAVAVGLRTWPGPGTLVLPVYGGVALDAVLPHVPAVPGWPLRIAAVVGATFAMALGGALVIRARVGVAAYDAVMLGLHRMLGGRIALVRLGMEASVLVVGGVLGGAVGLGTVLTGALIGPSLQFWLRRLGVRPPARAGARPALRRPAPVVCPATVPAPLGAASASIPDVAAR